jgi:hypothetical protein
VRSEVPPESTAQLRLSIALHFSDPHLRKSAFICGLSRRRTSASSVESLGEGGFVCFFRVHSRAFAVSFNLLFAICYLLFSSPPPSSFHRTTASESRNHLVPSIRPGVFISTLT